MTDLDFAPGGRGTHPRPLLVELAGTPGSGKTTARSGVHQALRQEGWQPFAPEEGGRALAHRTVLGRGVAKLPGERLRHFLAWRVYLLYRWLGAGRAMLRHPRHFLWLLGYQRRRPPAARTAPRRVIHWYLRMAGAQELYRRHARAGEAIVFDEGYLHRVVQLFSSAVDRAAEADLRRHLDAVPRPDLLVRMEAPARVCLDRIRERGIWERAADLSDEDLDRFIHNAEHVIRDAVAHARASGWNVVTVENSSADRGDLPARVAAAVRQSLARAEGEPSPSRPLRPAVPRPGQLALLVRGRLGRPALPADTVDEFLARLGTARRGRISNLPLARRSDSVVVDTWLGRLVVRGYPAHWPEESLRHEHSLLIELEAAGYPSTRLVPSPGGETMLRCEGRRLAGFRYVPGRNLSGSFLPREVRMEAHHRSGRLLSLFHRMTGEIRVAASHHLDMEGDGEKQLLALLSLLEELPSLSDGSDPLAARAEEVADRLSRLHSSISEAAPRTAIIHGDYGLHNLVFRRNGTATVVDFELARRDWCLVDFVEALGVMSEAAGRAFLSGYALGNGGKPQDWHLLPRVWEYHRLAGAVRAWDSYRRRNAPDRLEVVRRRLAGADRVARGEGPAWR